MAPNSSAARDLARRLLSTSSAPDAGASAGADVVAVTDRVFRQCADELTRWFGPFGYHALLSRALAEAKQHHPALENLRIRSATEPSLEGLAESVEQHGTTAVVEGTVAMLMAFIELLSRLIGEDMTLKLVDQCVAHRGTGADAPDKGGAS